jgi:hypothetical protein
MISDYFGPHQIAEADQAHAFAVGALGQLVDSIQAAIAREKANGQDVGEVGRVNATAAAMQLLLANAPTSNISLVLGLAAYRIATAPTSLADRMCAAADTLEEVSKLYQAYNPASYRWSAAELRHEAPHIDRAEEDEA